MSRPLSWRGHKNVIYCYVPKWKQLILSRNNWTKEINDDEGWPGCIPFNVRILVKIVLGHQYLW